MQTFFTFRAGSILHLKYISDRQGQKVSQDGSAHGCEVEGLHRAPSQSYWHTTEGKACRDAAWTAKQNESMNILKIQRLWLW